MNQALAERFDSNGPSFGYLGPQEREYRQKEQKQLSEQKMQQKIIVATVNVKDNGVSIDADRLIRIGGIRSAFKLPLAIKLATVERSESNPYGLIVEAVKPLTEEKGGQDD